MCVFVCCLTASARADEQQKVLVLNSYYRGYHWSDALMDGIQSEFNEADSGAMLYFEYLDARRCDPNIVFPVLEQLFRLKYKDVKFDAIISCDNNALDFLRDYKKELFPKVPVVFVGVSLLEDWMIKGLEPITGIVEAYDKETTIEVALKFHPSASQIVLIKNKDRDYTINYNGIIHQFAGQTRFVIFDVSEMTFEQFVDKLAEFGNESIVLFPNCS